MLSIHHLIYHMLAEQKLKVFRELVGSASREEIIWMQGYLTGLIAPQSQSGVVTTTQVATAPISKITVLYGTETGNAKKLATDFAAKAKKQQINAKVIGMDQYRLTDLSKEEYLFAIVSTHGDGEPPLAAKKFYDFVHENTLPLSKLKFGVLALGDTSYPLFCKTGEDIDAQFTKLGATAIVPLQKCDVEYDADAAKWFDKVLATLTSHGAGVPAVTAATATSEAAKLPAKKTNYIGKVIANINLNDEGSIKEIHHLELEAEGVDYLPGDSIGVVPNNPLSEVLAIIELVGIDAQKPLQFKNEPFTVQELLHKKVNIFQLTERLVKKYSEIVAQEIPAVKMDLLQLLQLYPIKEIAQFETFVTSLNAIAPRLYTIASSPEAHSGEVHLTVEKDEFHVNGQVKYGLCSPQVTALPLDSELSFFVQKNKRFKLPTPEKNIIMVGPGTGIAPFRAFLAERDATGASGKNWLFFADDNFATDFLYQTELQSWVETGVLTKLNVAFNKGHVEKAQVHHKLLQHGEVLYDWLTAGAHLYLCGQKEPMGVEVEKALLQIFEQYGKKNNADAAAFLNQLKDEGRYAKDVY